MPDIPAAARAALWVDTNVIGVREVPVAKPGPGDILVRIRACGICGSDLHSFHGPALRMNAPGFGPGHELVGEVAALGAGVSGPPVGTRVAVLAGRVCNACEFCRSGRATLCRQMRIAGAGYSGGMADYFMAQAPYVYPLPEGMSWPVAALSEPCGISLHALKHAGITRGQRVLVLGAGTIGLFATLVAHDAGASRLGVTARYPQQAEAARRMGATDVFDPSETGPGSECAKGRWDMVVETIGGSGQTLQEAINLVERGGTIALVGVHTVPQTIMTARLFLHDISIVGSFGYHHTGPRADYEEAIELLSKYEDRVAPLVTHTYPLEQAAEAFQTALDKRSGAIKVTVLP